MKDGVQKLADGSNKLVDGSESDKWFKYAK